MIHEVMVVVFAVMSYQLIVDIFELGNEFIPLLDALIICLFFSISLSISMDSTILTAIKHPCLHSVYHSLFSLGRIAMLNNHAITNPINVFVFTHWLQELVLFQEIVFGLHALFPALM